jgi:hypothetical protein
MVIRFYALMVLAGSAVGILAVMQRVRLGLLLGAITLPVFLIWGTTNLSELDEGVTARPAVLRASRCFPEVQLESAATYKVQRGHKFALNFYFRRELAEWSPPGGRRTIIFTTHNDSQELQKMKIQCFSYQVNPAVNICVDAIRPTSLMKNCPSSGEAHQKE